MADTAIRFDIKTPEFFAADPKKLKVEEAAGRVYFLLKNRIVAVGIPINERSVPCS